MAAIKKYEERIADLERALDDIESDAEVARELANEVDSNLYYYREDASERFDCLDESISRVDNRVDNLEEKYDELYDIVDDLPSDLVARVEALEKENENLRAVVKTLAAAMKK